MITHGKKQISEIVYARKASDGGGAVRLTNIIRGAQVVFGGLVPNVKWLKAATTQAILAAFGQDDGWQVIGATNAYLNGIAATDPTKASALAGLINEDPMLVCSLGLQPQGVTMPIRWLKKTGYAYINTGWKCTASSGLYVRFTLILPVVNSDYKVLGSLNGMRVGPYYKMIRAAFDEWGTRASILSNVPFTVEQNSGTWKCGSTNWSSSKGNASNQDTYIFAMNGGGVSSNTQWCSEFIAIKNGEGREMYPFIRNINGVDKLGMIDMLSDTFYQNAGSGAFSIDYTLPDGNPWTPRNQTP